MGELEGQERSVHVVLRMSRREILACLIAATNCRNLIELFSPPSLERDEVLQYLYALLGHLNHLEQQGGPQDEMHDVQLTFEDALILSKAIKSYFLMEQRQRLLFFHKRLTSSEVKSHLLSVLRR